LAYILLATGFAVNLVTDSIFIAYRASQYNFLIDGIIASSCQLLLPVALIAFGAFGIFAAQGAAAVIAMILSIYFLIKKFDYKPKFKINKQVLDEVLHFSFGNYIVNLLNIAPTVVIPIVILNRLGAAAAGYYYLAYMMANLLFTVAYAVSQSLFAEGSYGELALRSLAKRAAAILATIMIPASLAMALLGPVVLQAFGHGYSSNARNVIVLLAANGPLVAAYVLGSVLLRITKQISKLIVANSFYFIVISAFAISFAHRGLPWVAAAWLVGNGTTAILMFIFLSRWRQNRRNTA
jgi:O-antigen/teichoic acid export membrane protein